MILIRTLSVLTRTNNARIAACIGDARKTQTDRPVKEDKRLSEGNYFNSSLPNSLVLYTMSYFKST